MKAAITYFSPFLVAKTTDFNIADSRHSEIFIPC